MKTPENTIVKTEVRPESIAITLENGVTVHISSNPTYLHLSFSGIDLNSQDKGGSYLLATSFAHGPSDVPTLKLANYVDLVYTPRKD